jgi:sterol desaturase/sphingolipid hydroxylase (fatty acid hydroxylase superfamily)
MFWLFLLWIVVFIIGWFIVSLFEYISIKKRSKRSPKEFTKVQVAIRLVSLIVSSVFLALLLMIAIGFIALITGAIAFM